MQYEMLPCYHCITTKSWATYFVVIHTGAHYNGCCQTYLINMIALLLFFMQFNSLFISGLQAVDDHTALLLRVVIGLIIIIMYLKSLEVENNLIIGTAILAFFFLINLNATCINLIFTLWFVYLVRRKGATGVIQSVYYSTLLFSVFFALLVVKGIIYPDIVYIPETGRYRNNMGFWSANYPGFIAYSCFMTLFACKGYLSGLIHPVFRWFTNGLMAFFITIPFLADSRTPGYAMIASLMVFIALSSNLIRYLMAFYLPLVPVVLLAMSLYLPWYYHGGELDYVLSGRLSYYYDYLSALKVNNYFFGSPLPDFALDNSYLILMTALGLGFIIPFTYMVYRSVLNNPNKYFIVLVFSLICYGFTEAVMARAETSVVILFYLLMFIKTQGTEFDKHGNALKVDDLLYRKSTAE